MSDHLNFDEIFRIVNKTPESLETGRYAHFMNCKKCQREYKAQLTSDSILKGIKPKTAPASIIKQVFVQLSGMESIKIKEKTDWVFLVAIILLFTIGSWFVFSGKAISYLQDYTSQVVPEKQEIKNLEFLDSIKDKMPDFNFKFEFPDINWGNIYLALGIFVGVFYMLLDRKISHYFKVHKT